MVIRALRYEQRVGIIQFIKGTIASGEEKFMEKKFSEVKLYQLGTGFTWDRQDRQGDMEAVSVTWKKGCWNAS